MSQVLEIREYELAEFIASEFDLETVKLAIKMIERKRKARK